MLDPDVIARETARAIAADIDPSLPSRVEKALTALTRDCTAAFLVDAARHACRLGNGALPDGKRQAPFVLEQRLRREFGLNDGMSAEFDAIVAAIAEQVAIHNAATS